MCVCWTVSDPELEVKSVNVKVAAKTKKIWKKKEAKLQLWIGIAFASI